MRIIAVILVLFYLPVIGQSGNDSTPARMGLFKNWRLAGISLSVGRAANKKPGDLIAVFENTTTSATAKNKIASDIININGYDRKNFEAREHLRAFTALRFTLKPRVINWDWFASFTEISAALLYSSTSGEMLMSGESNSASGDTFNHYITNYYFAYETVGIDVG
ncbi:MAG TPA: hypothetical protein VEC12_12315 [Bacteroidia bacterium]|nr:hypothetical protein [Bacteroidia bacterium]